MYAVWATFIVFRISLESLFIGMIDAILEFRNRERRECVLRKKALHDSKTSAIDQED